MAAETVESEQLVCAGSVPDLRGGRFGNERKCYVEQHRVRSYEVGPDRRATVPTIANLLQVWPETETVLLDCGIVGDLGGGGKGVWD